MKLQYTILFRLRMKLNVYFQKQMKCLSGKPSISEELQNQIGDFCNIFILQNKTDHIGINLYYSKCQNRYTCKNK